MMIDPHGKNGLAKAELPTSATLLLLLIILLSGGFARYYRLGEIPRGLWVDEAADGNDASRANTEHDFRVFYRDDAGREGLWINLMALSVARFGHTTFAARFFAPLVGLLTILFLYLLAARWFGRRVALLSAWFLATSFWHVDLSRLALRGMLVPLFLTASLYFLQLAWDTNGTRSLLWAVVGGAVYGLGFHSYIAFRVTPILIAVFVGMQWRVNHPPLPHLARTTAVWLGVAFLVALPIGLYFLRNPQDFWTRVSQVSVTSAPRPWNTLSRSIIRTIRMFNYKGDCNWRHNLPCSPELIFPVGLFFLWGFWLAFRNWRRENPDRTRSVILLTWLFVLLIPAFLTRESIPHSLRSIGALPPVVILAAIGTDWLLTRYAGRKLLFHALLAVVVLSGVGDLYRYFFIWAHSPQLDDAFNYRHLAISEKLKALSVNSDVVVFVDEPYGDWQSTGFLHTNPDGSTVLLPEGGQIPIYFAGNRPNTTYLLSQQIPVGQRLSFLGCPPGVLPTPQTLPPLILVTVPECGHDLIVLRLSP